MKNETRIKGIVKTADALLAEREKAQ